MILPKAIKVKETLTIDGIFELLINEGTLPAEPYLYMGAAGGVVIIVPGEGEKDIQILLGKGKITIADLARGKGFFGNRIKETVLDRPPNGWSIILKDRDKNKKLFELVLSECTRLFEG